MTAVALPKLHQETLESVSVAVARAKDDRGLRVVLSLRDVLQPWVMEQMPAHIRGPAPVNPSGITPLEFKVLVKPSDAEVDPVLARAKAQGLQLPPDVLEREFAAQIVATFIAKGGNAFEDWRDEKLPAPGDTVLIAKYAGITVKGADGIEYRMLNDKDVSGLITIQGVSRV
jgi:co-chaperonin GroES (HSP10)